MIELLENKTQIQGLEFVSLNICLCFLTTKILSLQDVYIQNMFFLVAIFFLVFRPKATVKLTGTYRA